MFKKNYSAPKLSKAGLSFTNSLYPNFLDKTKNFLSNIFIQRKMNNSSVPQGLAIFPTGDKPILYSTEAVLFYLEVAPVATAIDKIAYDVASIPPLVYSKKKKEFIDDHPVLELLAMPDADITCSEFYHSLATWYGITGNNYIVADGFIEKPPITMRVYPSQATTIIVGSDGYAQNYTARLLNIVNTFNRAEVINYGRERLRFYGNEFNELYHIRSFNPLVSSNMAYGLSPLNAIYYEMRQYLEAAKYNLSILQRASKISGVLKIKNILTFDQRKRMEAQMQNMYSGATNAGRNLVIDGADTEYQDLMVNGRDMDYVKMREQVEKAIYKGLKIPLPLISEDAMTYSNLEGAKVLYYKQSVLPLRRKLDQELTNFLMPRYDNKDNDLIITFNEHDIPALESDRNEQAKIKKDIGIFTPNELRKLYAYDELDGGQNLFGKFGDTPIAVDKEDVYYTGEELNNKPNANNSMPNKPSDANDKNDISIEQGNSELENQIDQEPDYSEGKNKVHKDKFISTIRKQINRDGTPRFTEEEIRELVEKHYG